NISAICSSSLNVSIVPPSCNICPVIEYKPHSSRLSAVWYDYPLAWFLACYGVDMFLDVAIERYSAVLVLR
ncbi:hypothetical protein, partial [Streptococcus suis]|uniref:hypothetical protein n=1 Tax=Streptococcus suis TaxID=1307 RepID=UPI001C0B9D6F